MYWNGSWKVNNSFKRVSLVFVLYYHNLESYFRTAIGGITPDNQYLQILNLQSIKCIKGTSDKIIHVLKHTIRKYGKPLQILTDHGSQIYNSYSKLQSDFDSFCKEYDIEHVIGRVGKPTTLVKIERWHYTHM